MAVIAVAIALPATLLLRGGDDEQSGEPAIEVTDENAFNAKRLGVSGSAPPGWSVSKNKTHVEARSASGLGRVIITAPGRSDKAGEIFREAIDALGLIFKSARKGPTMREALIGDRPTRSAFVALKRSDGREVQAAVAVAQGAEDAYLVEVFVGEGAPPRRVREAEAVVDSLELSG